MTFFLKQIFLQNLPYITPAPSNGPKIKRDITAIEARNKRDKGAKIRP